MVVHSLRMRRRSSLSFRLGSGETRRERVRMRLAARLVSDVAVHYFSQFLGIVQNTKHRGGEAVTKRWGGAPHCEALPSEDSALPRDKRGQEEEEEEMSPELLTSVYQESVTFEDVCVDFTRDEWGHLSPAQRALYREVMLETFEILVSLGLPGLKPDVISCLERGEAPWMLEEEVPRDPYPGSFHEEKCETKDIVMRASAKERLQKQGVHTRKESNKWNECEKAFSQNALLTYHERILAASPYNKNKNTLIVSMHGPAEPVPRVARPSHVCVSAF
ncbi:zinc finger protein 829-like isoform X4 [Vombatus ursinus]|uniref:zinc finger protein 829-like isoform X4 n=1 Tax=Vombatus ursinus TaxID=29139 RepID=UPI000FFD590B|nr:zinc finger protein 829-like isoform X4 [Vombatus ursinus]